MKFRTLALGAIAGAAALVGVAAPASAYVACNRWGDCWHVRERYDYRPHMGIRIYDDSWGWRHRHHFHWREHGGRGYWRNGVWIRF